MIFYNENINDLVLVDRRLIQNRFEVYSLLTEQERDAYLKFYLNSGYSYIGEI